MSSRSDSSRARAAAGLALTVAAFFASTGDVVLASLQATPGLRRGIPYVLGFHAIAIIATVIVAFSYRSLASTRDRRRLSIVMISALLIGLLVAAVLPGRGETGFLISALRSSIEACLAAHILTLATDAAAPSHGALLIPLVVAAEGMGAKVGGWAAGELFRIWLTKPLIPFAAACFIVALVALVAAERHWPSPTAPDPPAATRPLARQEKRTIALAALAFLLSWMLWSAVDGMTSHLVSPEVTGASYSHFRYEPGPYGMAVCVVMLLLVAPPLIRTRRLAPLLVVFPIAALLASLAHAVLGPWASTAVSGDARITAIVRVGAAVANLHATFFVAAFLALFVPLGRDAKYRLLVPMVVLLAPIGRMFGGLPTTPLRFELLAPSHVAVIDAALALAATLVAVMAARASARSAASTG
jgi:hypothetical protein